MTPWFQHGDPLVGVLDYITQVCLHGYTRLIQVYLCIPKKCPVGTITMSPGDYFRQTENVVRPRENVLGLIPSVMRVDRESSLQMQ